MKKKSIAILCLFVVIAVILNYVAFFGYNISGFTYGGIFDEEKGIRKGIDLAGGSVITFQANTDNPTPEDMASVEAVFNKRLTDLGYTEARISSTEGGKITVEIPSVFNTDEAAEVLGKTAKLTFCKANGDEIFDGTFVKSAANKYGKTSETAVSSEAYVEIEFTPEGRQKFTEATKEAASAGSGNNYIIIKMDDAIISQASVDSKYASTGINSDKTIISGSFTNEAASELASQIKSGNLPFDLSVITQETVGAELGATALPKSLLAAGIGIILIMLFMIIMYRIPGLIADLSLAIYVGIVSLVLGLLRVNLSLSGIAGIVLSIGMAVDANVIIFERMKEELRLGKTIRASVESGFHKAFSAILDSNVTTIITCVVLYISGIGTVTGFATTLGLGVVVSMFTAIIITKFLLKQLVGIGLTKRSLFYSEKKNAERGPEA
ncbi:MAG: protein translocase subunit SecD [Clostridia bacterium]|nr:protein translocase subunit SecD [Clostridia bacterium]